MVTDVPIDEAVKSATDIIIQAANVSIPMTSGKVPNAVKLNSIQKSQRDSWISYVSGITSSTPSKRAWERVRKACGIYNYHSLSILEKDGRVISSTEEIANTIGENFAAVSSSDNYSPAFLSVKLHSEKIPIAFNSSNSEPYNSVFTMHELKRVLSQTRRSSPGLDAITYEMLKHLSYKSLTALLVLYNRVWKEHSFPNAWKRAVVIPIPKPGKDPKDPSNYRPIALTSCMCKVFEKMSLYVDCYETSLRLRREELSLLRYFNILSQPDHPYNLCICENSCDLLFEARPSCVPSFPVRVRPLIEEFSLFDISPQAVQHFEIAPWENAQIHLLDIFHNYGKTTTDESIYRQIFADHRQSYRSYVPIYTDGSKSACHVGMSFIIGDHMEGRRLHDASSVLTSELTAIYYALLYISTLHHRKFIVYTDSYSALKALESFSSTENPVIVDVLKLNIKLTCRGFELLYCWVPGHTGIKGNELADIAAKSAVEMSGRLIPFKDIRCVIKEKIRKKWQQLWDLQLHNKLRRVKPKIEHWDTTSNRREEVLLTRLRIGHSRVTHNYLLKAENEPICATCNVCLSVYHILIECSYFNNLREKYFNSCDLPLDRLIGREVNNNLFHYLKETGFYYLI
ncbi:uncharacterized protein LOC118179551 [Stegodyphus dumicola]|uniref:uncharacterized protein LOC118179551 n=1 Tax=Stegodyphus dumicola TaxID=202533 RepID=UPI0015ADE45F|nr:uncharacterized protein LOC118179551 [Stegodyphus dumicola]